jgi:hypothetical protein
MPARVLVVPQLAQGLPRPARQAVMGLHVLLCSMVAAHLAYSCFDVGRAHHAALFDCWVLSASLFAV